MSCDPNEVITSAELTGLKADIVTIDDVVESQLDATETKSGVGINTLRGQLKLLGYEPPVTYAGGIIFTVNDNTNTVDESGIVYAPLPSALPFTTSGTFTGDDDARFFVIQQGQNKTIIDYGAVGDGVTNSGTALYDACLSGQTVVIPASGTFIFDLTEPQVDVVLDHLRFIRAEQVVTIQLPTMDHTRTTTVYSGSAYADNLIIRGTTTAYQAATGVTTDSEASRNHLVTITGIANTAGYAVNGYAFVKGVLPESGGNMVLEGMWRITAVAATTVQLNVTAFKTTLPSFTLTSCSIAPALTVLRVHGTIGIDLLNEASGGLWQSMALVGNNTGGSEAHGIRNYNSTITLAYSAVEPFGVNGFQGHQIYTLAGGVTVAFDSFSSNAGRHGYYELDGSTLVGTRIIATGNGLAGHACSTNSNAGTSQANCSGNLQRGQTCAGTSIITSASAFMYENGDSGVRCQDNGFFNLTGSVIAGSASYGLRANGGTIFGSYTTDYGNTALLLTENNGVIDSESKRYHRIGVGSGASAVATAAGYVTDSDTANGISILTPEAQYGYLWFGNDVDNTEAGFRYRGTSNSLDFLSNGAARMSINSSNNLVPSVDVTMDLGRNTFKFRKVYAESLQLESPDGNSWNITVNNSGVLVVTAA